MTMLRLSRADAVIAQGTLCAVARIDSHVVELRPLGGEDAPMSLSHLELMGQINSGNFEIEYGYFGSRQAARRAMAGRGLLSLLSSAEQQLVFWKVDWCEAFLAAEASGEVSRSDRSCSAFIPELERRVRENMRQAANGKVLPDAVFRPAPCRTSLMGWVRVWEKSRDPMALVKRSRFNGVNARKIGRDQEAILQRKLADYLHPSRIFVPELHRAINAEIRECNADAGSAGLPTMTEVSESTVRRRLEEIDRFELCAARHGVAEAKNRLGGYGAGLQLDVPLQRIEMDEWEIDLMAILAAGGFDISDTRLRDLALGRYWVCVAFDAASRSILALKLSKAPCVEDALATIWMAMRDKTAIARRLGCETGWVQHGHLFHVVVDNGAALVDTEFKAALADLGIGYSVAVAGVPKLRARIERVFRTLATMLMPLLTGRTFSNPTERGDYPSEKYTVHTAESIVEALVRFVVDVYHNKPHRGLEMACPNDAWTRFCIQHGWSPPLGQHRLRHVLGIKLNRKLGRHGVVVCGVNYQSEGLIRHFQHSGGHSLDIRLDPENLGHVSVWYGDAWHSVPAVIDGMEGVSVAAWEQAVFEIRQSNRDASRLRQDVVDRAFARIREIDADQRAWRRLGPINISAAEIRRAEAETFYGLDLKREMEGKPIVDNRRPDVDGFLSDSIPPLQRPPAQTASSSSPTDHTERDDDKPQETWRFSDDDE